jgi:hypothetical protein
MKKENEAVQFDDLINDFYEDLESGDEREVLESYIEDFPEFEIDFIEAAAYKRIDSEVPDHEYTKEEEESLDLRIQSAIQNSLYKYRLKASSMSEPVVDEADDTILEIIDLYDEIKKNRFTEEEFYKKTKLSETVVEAFNNRQVRYGSIVRGAIQIISETLNIPVIAFESFIKKVPVIKPTHMKASRAPQFHAQMEFLELIEYDPDLGPDEKRFWMSQPTIDDEII